MQLFGVYLYINIHSYIEQTNEQLEENEIYSFNTQFLNYINIDSNGNKTKDITFQDVMTVANLAYDNNTEYEITKDDAGENSLYIAVNVWLTSSSGSIIYKSNIEENLSQYETEYLSENYYNKYICQNTDIKVSKNTGRVYEITFHLE